MSKQSRRRLHRILQANVLGGIVFTAVTAGLLIAGVSTGILAENTLDFLAVAGMFYSYLFWLADIFSRPIDQTCQRD